jgi:pentatricopeptide repeat protein
MVDSNITPSLRTYHSLLRACNDENRKAEARQLWSQMLSMGVVPSVTTYNTFMSSLSTMSEVRHLYGEMVHGHAAHVDDTGATVVSASSSFHGPLTPDATTFRVLLKFALKHGDLESVPWLLQQMRKYKIVPDAQFTRSIARVLAIHGKDAQANLLVLTSQKIGIQALTNEFVQRLCTGDAEQLQEDWTRLNRAVNDSSTPESSSPPQATR